MDKKNILGTNNGADLNSSLEIAYRSYCLAAGKPNTPLSFADSFKIRGCADEISEWIQRTNYNIIIDNNELNSSNSLDETDGNDLIFLGNSTSSVYAKAGNDVIYATDISKINDSETSHSLNRKVDLGAGSDTFYGFDGNDNVRGGSSNTATDINLIYLGGGSDNYIGSDGIDIVDGGSGATGDINADLYPNVKTFMTDSANDTNTVRLGDGDDIYYCGRGNDIVDGEKGNDTYFWSPDGGRDSITDNYGQNKIVFASGISKNNIIAESTGSTTILYTDSTKQEGLAFTGNLSPNSLSFADNPDETFLVGEAGLTFIQNDTDEKIYATDGNDLIYGYGGDDTISAEAGDDIIYAGAGNDNVTAYTGNDIIYGEQGNDTLDGGEGDDTYVYNLGDGFDTIEDQSGNDKIVFGEGISRDDLSFSASGRRLKILLNNDPTTGIQINNQLILGPSFKIETIEFHDGSTLDITDAYKLIQAMSTFGVEQGASDNSLSHPTQDVSEMYNLAVSNGITPKAI